MNNTKNSRGSVWHRWEPHIHTPGTLLNNQYTGLDGGWEDYIDRIDLSLPTIRALGITDYYDIECYEKVIQFKEQGRFPNVELIFPNIEIRFVSGTGRDKAINGHLLVSPDDIDHVAKTKRFLQGLHFNYNGHSYRCDRPDLVELGKAHNSALIDDRKALEWGANQFKVDLNELYDLFKSDTWALDNILLGVAGNTSDGTSGLSSEASFDALRKTYERSCHIIFSSSEKQRDFWVGKGVHTKEEIQAKWKNLKPCLHGSDAHRNDDVGKPVESRYTWIKGDLNFESLKQACIEPENRAYVGELVPEKLLPSRTIDNIKVYNAGWMSPHEQLLNPGLVTIIGPRGSGKTALADFIASGAFAIASPLDERSFISRAYSYLANVEVEVAWQAGDSSKNHVTTTNDDSWYHPRVQYLSQQFVDRLCSSEGVTDQLVDEIERVIFNSHEMHERSGTSNFRELLDHRTSNARTWRSEGEIEIENISTTIAEEQARLATIGQLEGSVAQKILAIEIDKKSREKFVGVGQDNLAANMNKVSAALDKTSARLESLNRQLGGLQRLQATIASARATAFPEYTRKLVEKHSDANLTEDYWARFNIDFVDDVNKLLSQTINAVSTEANTVRGTTIDSNSVTVHSPSFVTDYGSLAGHTVSILSCELRRLQLQMGVNNANSQQYSRLTTKISQTENELENLRRELTHAKGADTRIQALVQQRRIAYLKVVESIVAEQEELQKLYQPLMQKLGSQGEALGKLSFKVQRRVDVDTWANEGEQLLDLRIAGPFRGIGTMKSLTDLELKSIWETGTAQDISQEVVGFVERYRESIVAHSPHPRTDQALFRQWTSRIAKWLFSTKHITSEYSVQYEGVDIHQLSPGTRGIVLLLIFLAVDIDDDRPLLIDQPEENLDPKSIFDELVPLFAAVKSRRQIIIVTHNANLVINTDADQVIIAKGGQHRANQLPNIHYVSGGLENADIRKEVCRILEGGEAAFRERARRLRVNFH